MSGRKEGRLLARVRIFRDGELLRETQADTGKTVYAAVTGAGVYLDAPCAGTGRCGKCLVRLSPDGEEVKACLTEITGDTPSPVLVFMVMPQARKPSPAR